MSDPYLHIEENLGLTRKCLEIIDYYGFGLSIQTKSDRILRDLDLLKSIPTICWLTPILPYINDTEENIKGILDYCIEAKVYGILYFDIGMMLRDGERQYYSRKLDEHFPGLKNIYIKKFGSAYQVPSPKRKQLNELIKQQCRKNNIVCNTNQLFEYMHLYEDKQAGEQLSLFDLF